MIMSKNDKFMEYLYKRILRFMPKIKLKNISPHQFIVVISFLVKKQAGIICFDLVRLFWVPENKSILTFAYPTFAK